MAAPEFAFGEQKLLEAEEIEVKDSKVDLSKVWFRIESYKLEEDFGHIFLYMGFGRYFVGIIYSLNKYI